MRTGWEKEPHYFESGRVHTEEPTALRRRMGQVLWLCSAVIIAAATLIPVAQKGDTDLFCVVCGELGSVDVILNVLLFVPLGVGLGMAGIRTSRAIPVMCAATVLLETLQLVAVSGRDATVGDVLANSLGGIIGFTAGAHIGSFLQPSRRHAVWLMASWLGLWLMVQSVASYALAPRASEATPYDGQIGRPLGNEPPFPGRVLSATIDGKPIPDSKFSDSLHARDALKRDQGAVTEVTLVSNGPASELAPVLRIFDDDDKEVQFVAVERSSIVFRQRTGAAVLRLRPLLFRFRDVFATDRNAPDSIRQDTIRIRARFALPRVELSATSTSLARATTIYPTTGGSWRLIFPTRIYTDASTVDALVDAAWLFVLLMPAGYWGALARVRGDGSRRAAAIIVGMALALIVGFSIGPVGFGLAPPGWTEVVGGAAGLLVGATAAHCAPFAANPDRSG